VDPPGAFGALGSRALLPLYLPHGFLHVSIGIYPAVLFALRREWHASYATLGAVFTAATLLYGLGSLPTGFILNRVHPLTVTRLYLLTAAVACAVIALAPHPWVAAAGLLLLGLAVSPYHTAAMTLISRGSGNDPRLLAHHGMFGSLGLAIAPAFGSLLASASSWRLPFACAAGLALALATYSLTMPAFSTPAAQAPAQRSSVSHGATHVPALALVFSITVALGFVFRGFGTFLPTLIIQRTDVFSGQALVRGGLIASLVYLVGFFGQWWASRLGRHEEIEAVYAVLLVASAALLAAVFWAADWSLILVLLAFSVVHFAMQPIDNVLTGKYTSLGRRGIGYGVSFGLSFGFGSFAAWAGGAVADAAGGRLQYVYLMLAGATLVGAVCGAALTLLARHLRRLPVAATEPVSLQAAPPGPFI